MNKEQLKGNIKMSTDKHVCDCIWASSGIAKVQKSLLKSLLFL